MYKYLLVFTLIVFSLSPAYAEHPCQSFAKSDMCWRAASACEGRPDSDPCWKPVRDYAARKKNKSNKAPRRGMAYPVQPQYQQPTGTIIPVQGTLNKKVTEKITIENFKGCDGRSPTKRRKGMGHTDIPHSVVCIGGDCTLYVTVPKPAPATITYHTKDSSGACKKVSVPAKPQSKKVIYSGQIDMTHAQFMRAGLSKAMLEDIDFTKKTEQGRIIGMSKMGDTIKLLFQYKDKDQKPLKDHVKFGDVTVQVSWR